MAIKISALPAASATTGAEVLPVVQSGATVKARAQDLTFADATSGAGNIRLKVAPQGYGAVTALADAANVNVDISLADDGSYDFFVLARLKLVGGTRRTVAARICANRSAGALSIEGSQVDVALGGVTTGITLTLSATGGDLRVNVANATGSTVNGRVHAGWTIEDLIGDP